MMPNETPSPRTTTEMRKKIVDEANRLRSHDDLDVIRFAELVSMLMEDLDRYMEHHSV